MANQNRYKEKSNPVLSVLYVIVVVLLVVALVFMYRMYKEKRNTYHKLVEQASQTDAGYDIESRKADDIVIDLENQPDAMDTAVTLAPTVEPTVEVTAEPTAEVTTAPEPTAEAEPSATVFIPETEKDDLVDESLSKGIADN